MLLSFDRKGTAIDEETIYDKQHNIPVFIILMQGNTVLSDIIRKVTKAEFTHACISFNSKLSPMYSFGEKSSDPKEYTNESVNDKLGFVVQDTDDKMFKKDKIGYEVYTMYVTKSDKKKMVDRLNWFKEKNNFLGYDFVGLVKYELGLSSDGNLKKWFCSRFVAELIGQVKELGRSASLWSPQQIRDELPFISLVNKGNDLSKYNYKTTEKNMKNIKKGVYSYEENTSMELGNLIDENMTISESLALNEATLSSKDRKALPDKTFGLPEKRKFPLNDYDHVVLAIKFFNRCDKKDQEELAKNIFKAMKKYKVSMEKIGKNNKLRNYISGSTNEAVTTPVVGLTNKTPVIVDNMYNNAFTSLEMDEEIIRNCMMISTQALLTNEDKFYVPYIPYIQESMSIDPNIGFYKDRNGIFVMNENTKLRSQSYNDVDDIDDRTILYVTYGELNDSKLNDL